MNNIKNSKKFVYLILAYLCLAKPASAYLDPGTGSYVFQLLIAGLLGGMFFLKSIIKKIKSKIKNPRDIDDTHEKV